MLRRTCVFASVGSAGHVVFSNASRARKVDTLFFMLGCARCVFHKKRIGTRYVELVFSCPVGSVGSYGALWCVWAMKRRHTIFHARMGSVWFTELVFLYLMGSTGHVVQFGASPT
jgi:hypothetical protein